MIDEFRNGKHIEGSGRDLIETLSPHLPRECEEIREKL
jgi:hypothetical protein